MRLTPQTAGIIKSIKVSDGDRVRKGQVIAVMDSDIISKNIEEVEAGLENAEYVLEKQRQLFRRGVGTEFDTTQAHNQVRSLRKKLETLKTQAGKAVVLAPFDGYVEEVYPTEGEVGGPQVPICHIIGLRNLTATAEISESYLGKIDKGTPAKVIFPAIEVTLDSLTIDRAGKFINPNNRTYTIYIDITSSEDLIVPNLITVIKAQTQKWEDVLIIPDRSIRYDKNGDTFVFTVSEDEEENLIVKQVSVIKLKSYHGQTAVEADLKEGDKVVTKGAEGVEDRDKVRILQ